MDSFKTKYPVLTSFFLLIAAEFQLLATPGETAIQKVEGQVGLLPKLISFLSGTAGFSAEFNTLKGSPADIESAAEVFVTDLAFTSERAKAIISAAFPIAEDLIGLEPKFEALASAFKA